jgi:hypothetical protein
MSNLKDSDIDDLFRRASDKYPLRIDSADWDKMAAALDKDPAPAGIDGSEDQRRKRRFFWLLLLLPLGGAGYFAWTHAVHGAGDPGVAAMERQADREGARGMSKPVQRAKEDGELAKADGEVTPADGGIAQADGEVAKAGDGRSGSVYRPAGEAGRGSGRDEGQVKKDGKMNGADADQHSKRGATGSGTIAALYGQAKGDPNGTGTTGREGRGGGGQSAPGVVQDRDRFAGAIVVEENGSTPPFFTTGPLALEWAGDVQRARVADDYRLSVKVTAPPAVKNNDPAKPRKPKTSYLYAGILGAPDISTVKMQSVKGVGSTIGVLLGYAINARWSVETGAYIESKKYYTDGEYFKKTLPYGAKLLNVNGTCYMWEIPINVRYTFNPEGKMKWFATGGLSTYLMSKENYTYAYESTSGWYGQSNWNIRKASQYPFSIVNLSAGFEQRLGRVGNLRVEPYLRLPLEGIGTGKLPITSAGVNIGFTRRLW